MIADKAVLRKAYLKCQRGKRRAISEDAHFPKMSPYAYLVLSGELLNDTRAGKAQMTRSKVINISARYDLSVVDYFGTLYWFDEVPDNQ